MKTPQLTKTQIQQNTKLLIQVSTVGTLDEVRRLIPVSNPKAYDSAALAQAVFWGNTETVQLLLPVSDPKADDSYALQQAAINGHTEIVKLLIPVSDYDLVLQGMQNHPNYDIFQQCVDEYESLLQKEILTQALSCKEQHITTKRKI